MCSAGGSGCVVADGVRVGIPLLHDKRRRCGQHGERGGAYATLALGLNIVGWVRGAAGPAVMPHSSPSVAYNLRHSDGVPASSRNGAAFWEPFYYLGLVGKMPAEVGDRQRGAFYAVVLVGVAVGPARWRRSSGVLFGRARRCG